MRGIGGMRGMKGMKILILIQVGFKILNPYPN